MLTRLWNKVDFPQDLDECWPWTASTRGDSQHGLYGNIKFKGKVVGSHRLVYECLVGPIPAGLTIDHLCKNTLCMNPDHMEVVTNAENARRGRKHNRGKTHCFQGHEFTPENTRTYNGMRTCITCRREYKRRWRARRVVEGLYPT